MNWQEATFYSVAVICTCIVVCYILSIYNSVLSYKIEELRRDKAALNREARK